MRLIYCHVLVTLGARRCWLCRVGIGWRARRSGTTGRATSCSGATRAVAGDEVLVEADDRDIIQARPRGRSPAMAPSDSAWLFRRTRAKRTSFDLGCLTGVFVVN